MAVLVSACKKEIMSEQPPVSVDASGPCYGNDWDYASTYPTRGLALEYNDKIYVPDYAGQTVKIYDGAGWTSIPSVVPISSTAGNPNVNLYNMVAFTIGNKGYIMKPSYPQGGFWEYDFVQNTWMRKADFPGFSRYDPACFSIGNKGYIVGGWKNIDTYLSETWQYNQSTNTWSQKASIGSPGRASATGFTINNKGYIVCGRVLIGGNEDYAKGLLEYDPSLNSWSFKAIFPGEGREKTSAFVIGDKAYVGAGGTNWFTTIFQDFYRYNAATNSWIKVADFPFAAWSFFGFSINSRGYCVANFGSHGNIMYKYTPQYCLPDLSQSSNSAQVN
jgi:N-acetylneuraminic acid mutarotase